MRKLRNNNNRMQRILHNSGSTTDLVHDDKETEKPWQQDATEGNDETLNFQQQNYDPQFSSATQQREENWILTKQAETARRFCGERKKKRKEVKFKSLHSFPAAFSPAQVGMSAMHMLGVHTERQDIISSWILAWLQQPCQIFRWRKSCCRWKKNSQQLQKK